MQFNNLWGFCCYIIILNLSKCSSNSVTSSLNPTKGLLTKIRGNIKNYVNEGINSTGTTEMLAGSLDDFGTHEVMTIVPDVHQVTRQETPNLTDVLHVTTLQPDTLQLINSRIENDRRKIKNMDLTDPGLDHDTKTASNLTSVSISTEDIVKLQRMEDYYKNVLSGVLREKPNPSEIERHRTVLVKIFNQLMAHNQDNRLNSSIIELLPTISNVTNLVNLTHSSSTVEITGINHKDLLQMKTTDNTDKNSVFPIFLKKTLPDNKIIIIHEFPEAVLKNNKNFTVKPSDSVIFSNSFLPPVEKNKYNLQTASGNIQPHLNNSKADRNRSNNNKTSQSYQGSKNSSNFQYSSNHVKSPSIKKDSSPERLISNMTISKRYGQVSDGYFDSSPFSLNLYRPQTNLNLAQNSQQSSSYLAFPQPSRPTYQSPSIPHPLTQGIEQQRVTLNQGTFHILPQPGSNIDSHTESPLSITDSAAVQGDVPKSLLDILLQYNEAGSLSEYNNVLEALLRPQKASEILFVDNINLQDLTITSKPPTRSPFSSTLGNVESISPEVLANLLIRLHLPNSEELRNLSNQITRLGSVVQDTRQDLPASIEALLMTISAAISSIITQITALCAANPLACVILALALCALVFHIYKKHGKKKKYHHKDSGYGGHDHGGYHRKIIQDYDEYRMLDSETQLEVVSDVLGKIDIFENWLHSLKSSGNGKT